MRRGSTSMHFPQRFAVLLPAHRQLWLQRGCAKVMWNLPWKQRGGVGIGTQRSGRVRLVTSAPWCCEPNGSYCFCTHQQWGAVQAQEEMRRRWRKCAEKLPEWPDLGQATCFAKEPLPIGFAEGGVRQKLSSHGEGLIAEATQLSKGKHNDFLQAEAYAGK